MNRERLIRAYEIIGGIPADRFNLRTVRRNVIDSAQKSNPHHCGTIACAMGWLGMHPEFPELESAILFEDPGCYTQGFSVDGQLMGFVEAAAKIFDISSRQAESVFGTRRRAPKGKTDQEVFLERLRKLLVQEGSKVKRLR